MRNASILLVLSLCACKDPMEGDWEAKDSNVCGRAEFSVDDELKGDGKLFTVDTTGSCIQCNFDLTLEDEEDDVYKGDLDFDNCQCPDGGSSADVECSLNDDNTEVDCEIDWGSCLNDSEDFEKQD